MKLSARLFLILTGMALIPLLGSTIWQAFHQKAAVDNVFQLHQGIADYAAMGINDWFSNVNHKLAFIYDIDKMSAGHTLEDDSKIIHQVLVANSDIVSLSVVSGSFKEVLRMHDDRVSDKALPEDYAAMPSIQQAKSTGRVALGEVMLLGEHSVLPIAYPLANGRVVAIYFSLSQLWKKISLQAVGKSGMVAVITNEGKIIPGQSKSEIVSEPQELKAALSSVNSGMVKNLLFSPDRYSGAYSRIKFLPWTALSLQKDSEIFGPQKRFLLGFALFSVLSLAGCIAAAYSISRKIASPVVALVDGAGRIASQDFSRQIPETGWPELRALSVSFNRMTAELRRYNALQVDKIIEEKTKAETLVNTIPDGVMLADSLDRLVYANPTAMRLLGPGIQMDCQFPYCIKRAEFRDGIKEVMKEALKPVSCDIELLFQSEPPVKKFYRIFSTPYSFGDAGKHGKVLIIRDISHEKEMDRMKDDFFNMITHDMRSPLSTIQGYLEMLVKIVSPTPKTEKYFSYLQFSTRTLRGMVDDILNLNKLETGRLILQVQKISAVDLLAKLQGAYEPVANMRNIKIEVLSPPAPLVFDGDAVLLERVLANLVGNALKFTPAGGKISLSGEPVFGRDMISLSVTDTGPGIPDDKKEFIFEKFRQLEGHEHMGYGLGLSMCKMAVELHGGAIWVESQVGKGSKFIFTISKNLAAAANALTKQ